MQRKRKINERANDNNKRQRTDAKWDIVGQLPVEISTSEVSSHLDHLSLRRAMLVSQSWYSIFSTPFIWKYRIQQDFSIFPSQSISNRNTNYYKSLYDHLYRIHNSQRRMPQYLFYFNVHPEYQQQLLALLSNDTNQFFNEIPSDEYDIWLKIALYLNYDQIYKAIFEIKKSNYLSCFATKRFFRINESYALDLLKTTMRTGNLEAVIYLLKPENNFNLRPNIKTLNEAARSGNLDLVKFLLDCYPELTNDSFTLRAAIKSGNVELIQFLIDLKHLQIFYYLNESTLIDVVRLGNIELVEIILEKFKLIPNINMLNEAARSGNVELVTFFITHYNIIPDDETLFDAARSGNLTLVIFLLDQKFNLNPNIDMFSAAARSGNLELVKLLLDEKFNLSPDLETLNEATRSGNLELVKFLLAQKNAFNLTIHKETLDHAARSGNLKLVKYLLDLGKNLRPDSLTLINADYSCNLDLVKFLLNPSHEFYLTNNILFFLYKVSRTPNLYQLNAHSYIACEMKMRLGLGILMCAQDNMEITDSGLPCLSERDEKVKNLFMEAHQYSPRHFFHVITYTLQHKDRYRLYDHQVNLIFDLMTVLIMNKSKYVTVESETIKQFLQMTKESSDKHLSAKMDDLLEMFNVSAEPKYTPDI